jgi:hypothetical protein
LLEESDDYLSFYDPVRSFFEIDPSYGLHFATETFGENMGSQGCSIPEDGTASPRDP